MKGGRAGLIGVSIDIDGMERIAKGLAKLNPAEAEAVRSSERGPVEVAHQPSGERDRRQSTPLGMAFQHCSLREASTNMRYF